MYVGLKDFVVSHCLLRLGREGDRASNLILSEAKISFRALLLVVTLSINFMGCLEIPLFSGGASGSSAPPAPAPNMKGYIETEGPIKVNNSKYSSYEEFYRNLPKLIRASINKVPDAAAFGESSITLNAFDPAAPIGNSAVRAHFKSEKKNLLPDSMGVFKDYLNAENGDSIQYHTYVYISFHVKHDQGLDKEGCYKLRSFKTEKLSSNWVVFDSFMGQHHLKSCQDIRTEDESADSSVGMDGVPTLSDLSLWKYRRLVEIVDKAGLDISDVQVRVIFDTKSLIDTAQMASDCRDLRVFSENLQEEIPYWIESDCNTHETVLWIRMDLRAYLSTKVYLYYGNESASDQGDPTKTFDLFDAFSAITQDEFGNVSFINPLDRWESSSGWSGIEIYDDKLLIGTTKSSNQTNELFLKSPLSLKDSVFEARVRASGFDSLGEHLAFTLSDASGVPIGLSLSMNQAHSLKLRMIGETSSSLDYGATSLMNFQNWGIFFHGDQVGFLLNGETLSMFQFFLDFDLFFRLTFMSSISNSEDHLASVDWYRVRKFLSVLPAIVFEDDQSKEAEEVVETVVPVEDTSSTDVEEDVKVEKELLGSSSPNAESQNLEEEASLILAPIVSYITNPTPSYQLRGYSLTDGQSHYSGELGWTPQNVEFVLDLGRSQSINSVVIHYLESALLHCPPPKSIFIYVSSDGVNFVPVAAQVRGAEVVGESAGRLKVRLEIIFEIVLGRFVKIDIPNTGGDLRLNEIQVGQRVPNATIQDIQSNWGYRRPMRISEREGASRGQLQVPMVFDTESLVTQGKLRSDCGDLRILNHAETQEIPYWIESGCNTNQTRIWLKLPYLPAYASEILHLYYGNPNAQKCICAPDSVFVIYEDFNDLQGWNEQDPHGVIDGSGSLGWTNSCRNGTGGVGQPLSLTVELTVEFEIRLIDATGSAQMQVAQWSADTAWTQYPKDMIGLSFKKMDGKSEYTLSVETSDGGEYSLAQSISGVVVGQSYWARINVLNSSTMELHLFSDENQKEEISGSPLILVDLALKSEFSFFKMIQQGTYGTESSSSCSSGMVDELRIRKYIRIEPQITFGFEMPLGGRQEGMSEPVDLIEGLEAIYHFDGSGVNSTSNPSIDASVLGAVYTTDRFGSAGKAISFDGIDDVVTIPNDPSIQSSQFSVGFWTYLRGLPEVNERSVFYSSYQRTCCEKGMMVFVDDRGRVGVRLYSGVSDQFDELIGTAVLDLDLWMHISIVFDGLVLKIYVNGNFVAQKIVNFDYAVGTGEIEVSQMDHNGQGGFEGMLDKLQIYSRPLVPSEAKALYQDSEFIPALPDDETIVFYAGDSTVSYNGSTPVYWTANGLMNCQGGDLLSGRLDNSGSLDSGSVIGDQTYTITCQKSDGTTVSETLMIKSIFETQDIGTIINHYSAIIKEVSSGSGEVEVRDGTTFLAGSEILIMQMQDETNAGTYEFAEIHSISGNILKLSHSLVNSYRVGTWSSSGVSTAQVITVPHYGDFVVNGDSSLTAKDWDGREGGVLIFRSSGTVTNKGTIDVSQKGFRGGIAGSNDPENFKGYTAMDGAGGGGGGIASPTKSGSKIGKGGAPNGVNGYQNGGAGGYDNGYAGGGGGGGGYIGGGSGGGKGSDGCGTYRACSGTAGTGGGGGGLWGRGGGGGGAKPYSSHGNDTSADFSKLLLGGGAAAGGGGGSSGAGSWDNWNGVGEGGHGGHADGRGGVASGGRSAAGFSGTSGAAGGGLIMIYADTLTLLGSLKADGGNGGTGGKGGDGQHIYAGAGGGGGGGFGAKGASGGTILLSVNDLDFDYFISAKGGSAGSSGGGGSGNIGGYESSSSGAGGSGLGGSQGTAGKIKKDVANGSCQSDLIPSSPVQLGAYTVTSANTVINSYAALLAPVPLNTKKLFVRDGSLFSVGDEILVIQMQDDQNAGVYEFARVSGISQNLITVEDCLTHTYDSDGYNGSGVSTAQVVKIPNYTSVTVDVGATLTSMAWDGREGGILIFRSSGAVINNGLIDVSEKGFRGGQPSTSGPFAEGATGYLTIDGAGGGGGGIASPTKSGSKIGKGGAPNGVNGYQNGGAGGYDNGYAGGGGGGGGYVGGGSGGGKGSDGCGTYRACSGTAGTGGGGGGLWGRGGGGGGAKPYRSHGNDTSADFSKLLLGGGAAAGGGGGSSGAGSWDNWNGVGEGGHGGHADGRGGVASGGRSAAGFSGTSGAAGGGMIVIYADSITLSGYVTANGGQGGSGGKGGDGQHIYAGAGGGGGGGFGANGASGGTIFLLAPNLNLGSFTLAVGGSGGTAGSGGSGAGGGYSSSSSSGGGASGQPGNVGVQGVILKNP